MIRGIGEKYVLHIIPHNPVHLAHNSNFTQEAHIPAYSRVMVKDIPIFSHVGFFGFDYFFQIANFYLSCTTRGKPPDFYTPNSMHKQPHNKFIYIDIFLKDWRSWYCIVESNLEQKADNI